MAKPWWLLWRQYLQHNGNYSWHLYRQPNCISALAFSQSEEVGVLRMYLRSMTTLQRISWQAHLTVVFVSSIPRRPMPRVKGISASTS